MSLTFEMSLDKNIIALMVLPYILKESRCRVTHETILRTVQMVSVLIIFYNMKLFMFTNRMIVTLVMMKLKRL